MKKIFLSFFSFLLVISVQVSNGTTYYVNATDGNDSNDGKSRAKAWRTLANVNNYPFQPGDSVLLKRGEEWREQLIPSSNGSRKNPITFGAYAQGAAPIINGCDLVTGWTRYSTNIWKARFIRPEGPTQVFFNGTKGNKRSSLTGVDSEYDWYWDADNLYIYNKSDPNTANGNNLRIEATQRNRCVLIEKNHIILSDIHCNQPRDNAILIRGNSKDVTIQNCFATNANSWGVMAYETAYLTIRNCRTDNVDGGIYIGGSAVNKIHHTIVEHNTISNCKEDGIAVHNMSEETTGDYHHIHHNTIYNVLNEDGLDINCGAGVIAEYNRIYNCAGHGIYVWNLDGGVIVRNNTINDIARQGIAVTQGANHKLFNNLIFDIAQYGIFIDAPVRSIEICHNTVHESRTRVCLEIECKNAVVKNNIFYSDGSEAVKIDTVTASKYTFENNCYYRVQTESPVLSVGSNSYTMDQIEGGIVYADEGIEQFSLGRNPLFIDAENRDFQIGPESPCIDSGAYLTKTTLSGSSKQIPIKDAKYFFDGLGFVKGDIIKLEGQVQTARVTNVNLEKKILTINKSLSWYSGQGVSLSFSGSAPDVGAYESEYPLDVQIIASPTLGRVPLVVNFSGKAKGGSPPYSFYWEFGDGDTSTEINPTHIYDEAGIYMVTLTVKDSLGDSAQTSLNIFVRKRFRD